MSGEYAFEQILINQKSLASKFDVHYTELLKFDESFLGVLKFWMFCLFPDGVLPNSR